MMCKKHPKHRQSPGVCSVCLREKLTKLPSTSSSRATTVRNASTCSSTCSSLSSLSSECSSNASCYSSPMHHHSYRGRRPRRQEVGLEGKAGNFLSFLKMSIKNDNKIVLTKSRSMAFVEERERISMDNNNNNHGIVKKKNKGEGFWSKLIRSKSSNKRRMIAEGGLMHSRTMRDMLTTS